MYEHEVQSWSYSWGGNPSPLAGSPWPQPRWQREVNSSADGTGKCATKEIKGLNLPSWQPQSVTPALECSSLGTGLLGGLK